MAKRKRSAQTNEALLALREQVALVNWWESDVGEAFGRSFMADKQAKGFASHLHNIADIENHKLDRASTYWLSGNMQTLVDAASQTMPTQELKPDDLPSPYGFVWLHEHIEEVDRFGLPLSYRAIAWMPMAMPYELPFGMGIAEEHGVHVTFYTDLFDYAEDEFRFREVGDGWNFNEREIQRWLDQGNPRLMIAHEGPWAFGQDFEAHMVDENLLEPGLSPAMVERIKQDTVHGFRFLAALWTIMGQKLTALERTHVPQAMLKPLYNRPVPPEVIYVDLRRIVRPASAEHPERDVVWNHRWKVNGFWRNQYLPSTGGHRLQWINDFIKGPDHLPLVIKDRVFRVRR